VRKKIITKIFLAILIFVAFSTLIAKPTFATISVTQNPSEADMDSGLVTFTLTSDQNEFLPEETYIAVFYDLQRNEKLGSCPNAGLKIYRTKPSPEGKTLTIEFKVTGVNRERGNWEFGVWLGDSCERDTDDNRLIFSGEFYIAPPGGGTSTGEPGITTQSGCSQFQANSNQPFLLQNLQANRSYTFWIEGQSKNKKQYTPEQIDTTTDPPSVIETLNVGGLGDRRACLAVDNNTGCDYSSQISVVAGLPSTCVPIVQSNQPGLLDHFRPYTEKDATPLPCSNRNNGKCTQIMTAIGPIDTSPEGFIGSIFKIILSLSGFAAVIIIIYSGYRLITSQGDKEKIQGARETITSAILGLLFIIFSIFILELIGVDILQIPGLLR